MQTGSVPRVKHAHSSSYSPVASTSQSFPSFNQPSSPMKARGHRPSLSTTMNWLSRSSTSTSTRTGSSMSISKLSRASDPRPAQRKEILHQQNVGLGAGATVVRTPDDALKDSGVRLDYDGIERTSAGHSLQQQPLNDDGNVHAASLTPPSPPLPPIPPVGENKRLSYVEEDVGQSEDEEDLTACFPPVPTHAIPPTPSTPSLPLRSSLKARSRPNSNSEEPVPRIPSHVAVPVSPRQPQFNAILLSDIPATNADRSKIIVTLETSSSTCRTTYATLTSRPSWLEEYLISLFPMEQNDSVSEPSVYSTASDDISAYQRHLASQGLLASGPTHMHIFLDRPSAPYAHILSYLRSPASDVEMLPRAVQLQPLSHSRVEALLELRDEALYLGLQDLHKLCIEELRQRQLPRLQSHPHHKRGQSTVSNSVQSMHASVYNMQGLFEEATYPVETVNDKGEESKHARSPPTPQSWNEGRGSQRSRSRTAVSREAPGEGWL